MLLLAEKKILVTLTQALDSQAKELKSLSESLSHSRESINITREDRFSQYRPLEEHAPPAIRNGQCHCRQFMLQCLTLLSEYYLVLCKIICMKGIRSFCFLVSLTPCDLTALLFV